MKRRGIEGLVGPTGQPLRGEAAHRAFRRKALDRTPRVVWEFPVLDGIEHRDVPLQDVVQHCENDPDHPVAIEVARLMKRYIDDFRSALTRLARHYNPGETPQVGITRWPPRWPIEHVAQHVAAAAIQEVLIDATEEAPLLHPDAGS